MNSQDELRRQQLSSAIHFLFGITSAALAFSGSLLTASSVKLGGIKTTYFLLAVSFLVVALIASVIITFTRLFDARITAEIARKRNNSSNHEEVKKLRSLAHCLGKWTWRLFYIQLIFFFVGFCLLLISIFCIFTTKLFP